MCACVSIFLICFSFTPNILLTDVYMYVYVNIFLQAYANMLLFFLTDIVPNSKSVNVAKHVINICEYFLRFSSINHNYMTSCCFKT